MGSVQRVVSRSSNQRSITPLSTKEFSAVINRVTRRWKGGVPIHQVQSFADLPAAIQEEANKQGSDGSDIRGVLHEASFFVALDNLASIKEIEEIIFHEGYLRYSPFVGQILGEFKLLSGPADRVSCSILYATRAVGWKAGRKIFPFLELIWADGGYLGPKLAKEFHKIASWKLEIMTRNGDA